MSLTPDEIRARCSEWSLSPYDEFLDVPAGVDCMVDLLAVADTALALYGRIEALEAVVRALAESDPYFFLRCRFCGWDKHGIVNHDSSCPWRQARELTEGAG